MKEEGLMRNIRSGFFSERKKRTPSMISVRKLKNDISQIQAYAEKEDKAEMFQSTYCVLHVNQIQSMVNYTCETCKNIDKKTRNMVQVKTYGMALAINLIYSKCKEVASIPPRPSSFARKGLNGTPSQ